MEYRTKSSSWLPSLARTYLAVAVPRKGICAIAIDLVLASGSVTNISTSASVLIPRPREEVFAWATDSTNAPETMRSRGPFAGITKVEMHEGQTLAKGSRRRITMTDGTVLEEVILDYDPPVRHRYGWTGGAKFPFSLLVRSGTGNWDFTEAEGGTRIVWTYTFGLTSPLAYPLAIPIIWLFKGWLQQGLEALRAEMPA